jgi:regulator of RNase E activity RraA
MPILHHPAEIAPLDAETAARWRKIPASIAADIAPDCLIDPAIRPLCPPGEQPALFGRALTLRCTPPDFGSVLAAMDLVQAGDVLVIDAGSDGSHAMIGDILCGHLVARGVAGVVCNGAVRDVAEVRRMTGLSVYSRSVNPRGPFGAAEGAIGLPVSIAGLVIRTGDLILGDDDGLVALPPARLDSLLPPCEEKLGKEGQWRARLAAGETAAKIFGLAPLTRAPQ